MNIIGGWEETKLKGAFEARRIKSIAETTILEREGYLLRVAEVHGNVSAYTYNATPRATYARQYFFDKKEANEKKTREK